MATEPSIRPRTRSTKAVTPERQFPRAKSDDEANWENRQKEYVNTHSVTDPFADTYTSGIGGALTVIQPPYNFHALARLPYENSTLLQCIDAMIRNCDGHGWYLEYIGDDKDKESGAALAEKATLEKLLKYPNADYSFQELRERLRMDKEATGNAFLEIGLDRKGRVTMLHHVPASTVRRTMRDREETEYDAPIPRDGSDTSRVRKRFCRYVQLVNEKRIYFKEWGDPRAIDPETGQVNDALPFDKQATAIHHFSIYHPASTYGVPRWINQLPSILGSRQAELTNYDYFKDNAIPAMAILVAGGVLTGTTLDNLEDQFSAIKGRAAAHRMVFIEARGDEDLASQDGQVPIPKIEMKSLRGEQQSDALFEKYEDACEVKTRSSFRLPPLFTGRSQDYTLATAKTSITVAEGQVFGPERRAFDDFMDTRILSTYAAKYWAFRTQPAKITDAEEVIDALVAFDEMGAMTPNMAIQMANEYFDLDMASIEEPWGNWPFEIVKTLATSGRLKGMEEIAEKIDPKLATLPGAGAPPADKPEAGPANTNPKTPADAEKSEDAVLAARALYDLREILTKQAA